MAWKTPTRSTLILGLLTTTGVWLPAAVADACSEDPCVGSDRWSLFEPQHDVMLEDGVIVFRIGRGEGGELDDAAALEHVRLSVETTDGVVIEGGFELVPELSAVLFIPDEPIPAGAQLEITRSIDNEGIDDREECQLYGHDTVHTMNVLEGSMADVFGDTEIAQSHELVPHREYDTLVCCDGAYPEDLADSCGSREIVWSEGDCTSTRGVGRAVASLAAPEDLPEPALANLMLLLVADDGAQVAKLAAGGGTLQLSRPALFDAHFEIVNLAMGEALVTGPTTVGTDWVDALGELDIDPTDALEAACAGPAYVCETIEREDGRQGWDETQCEPWAEEGGETETDSNGDGPDSGGETDGSATAGLDDGDGGCGCTTGRGSPTGLLVMLGGLLGMSTRRRRTSTRPREL
jgi:MYXO-CTERM domain-containing protein